MLQRKRIIATTINSPSRIDAGGWLRPVNDTRQLGFQHLVSAVDVFVASWALYHLTA